MAGQQPRRSRRLHEDRRHDGQTIRRPEIRPEVKEPSSLARTRKYLLLRMIRSAAGGRGGGGGECAPPFPRGRPAVASRFCPAISPDAQTLSRTPCPLTPRRHEPQRLPHVRAPPPLQPPPHQFE